MSERRSYSRHGLNAVKAKVKVRGLTSIDMRTAEAQALFQWRSALLTDLGGEQMVSSQQMALVDMAVRTRLYIDHVDAYLMEQRSGLVNRKRKALLPVVKERQQLIDSYARILGQLGLERKSRPVPALAQHIAEAERCE